MSNFWWALIWLTVFIPLLFLWGFAVWDILSARHDLSGWAKAGWAVLLIFVPWFGALIYLIVRGRSMNERQARDMAQMQAQQDQYIRQVAGSGGGAASPADQIASAKSLLDSGAITTEEFESLKAKALA